MTARLVRAVIASACAGLAFAGCSDDGGLGLAPLDRPTARVPPELEQVAGMGRLTEVLADRPASCRTTHPIIIRDAKPMSRTLTIAAGACLVWGNKGSAPVRLTFAGSPDERPLQELRILPQTVFAEGSLETLSPRAYKRMLADEGGKSGCGKSRQGSYYGVQHYRADKRPVTISYTVTPGGAQGRIILRPKPRPRAAISPDVEAARRLRCGRNVVDGRPAGCTALGAVLIDDRAPAPAELRIARRGACVVFANKGTRTLRIESESCAGCFFSLFIPRRRRPARTPQTRRGKRPRSATRSSRTGVDRPQERLVRARRAPSSSKIRSRRRRSRR